MDACLFHCKYPGITNARIFTEEQHNHDGTGLSQVVLNAIFNLVCLLQVYVQISYLSQQSSIIRYTAFTGPWTPTTLISSMSAVELGPLMMLIHDGIRSPACAFWCNFSASCAIRGRIVLLRRIKREDSGSRLNAVSYTHLTLPTSRWWCRSRWSPYH